ncbi:MAG: hypothetical protein HZA79_12585 [Sphingobacteriales bacterium]|nr:hypothetical protein [Sphingobacteriales bacterium]
MNTKKLWKCPRCGRRFERQGQTHSCHVVSLKEHFEGKEKGETLYYKLVQAIKKKTGPFRTDPVKCCIHLVDRSTFAAVRVLRQKIRVDFTLPYKVSSPRLLASVKISAHRYLYYTDVTGPAEINAELISWIGEARHREKAGRSEESDHFNLKN